MNIGLPPLHYGNNFNFPDGVQPWQPVLTRVFRQSGHEPPLRVDEFYSVIASFRLQQITSLKLGKDSVYENLTPDVSK